MSAPFLISKAIDPIFSISIGIAAAAVRVNREEKERGKTTSEIVDTLKRRVHIAFGSDASEKELEKKT